MCILLAGERLQAQALKSKLETRYDERIEPRSFYGALEDAGFITSETEGIHDVYLLTDAGEQRLREHLEWMHEQIDSEPTQEATREN